MIDIEKLREHLVEHDPTSPECLAKEAQIEESNAWKKAAEVRMVASVVEIACLLLMTVLLAVIAMSLIVISGR